MKKYIVLLLLAMVVVPAMAQKPQPQKVKADQPQKVLKQSGTPNRLKQEAKHDCANCPHHGQHNKKAAKPKFNADGIAFDIVELFPQAKSVSIEKKWTLVYDAKKNLLGYAVNSKPASDGIKGFSGETPLLIALDPKMKVMGVLLLENNETPSYVTLVTNSGLLKSWNGMKVKKACKHTPDAVSGATFTSTSVIKTFQAAMNQLK